MTDIALLFGVNNAGARGWRSGHCYLCGRRHGGERGSSFPYPGDFKPGSWWRDGDGELLRTTRGSGALVAAGGGRTDDLRCPARLPWLVFKTDGMYIMLWRQ